MSIPYEHEEQLRLAQYLDQRALVWCHVPNEGKRSGRRGRDLVARGLKRGVPDVLIYSSGHDGRPLAIELKRQKGGRVTDHQRRWLDDLEECGWRAEVCLGAGAAIAVVEEHYGPPEARESPPMPDLWL